MTIRRSLAVPDLSCDHCVATIHQTLAGIEGLVALRCDMGRKQVHLDISDDKAMPNVLSRLAQAGYPARVLDVD